VLLLRDGRGERLLQVLFFGSGCAAHITFITRTAAMKTPEGPFCPAYSLFLLFTSKRSESNLINICGIFLDNSQSRHTLLKKKRLVALKIIFSREGISLAFVNAKK